MMYVSITGLKPKNFISTIQFWRLAIPTFRQAQLSEGMLFSSAKRLKGYQCTLTTWESREQMLVFMRSGAHLKAMKAFHTIATGKTFGFESDTRPTWEEAVDLLLKKGKDY